MLKDLTSALKLRFVFSLACLGTRSLFVVENILRRFLRLVLLTTATKDFKASVAENFIHTLPKPYKSDLRTGFTGPLPTAFRRPVHNTKGRHVQQFRGFALLQRRYYPGAATGHASGLSWTLTSGIKVILDVP